jgi:hypothetical protein
MAMAGLLIFAWRVFGETLERTSPEDGELVCRYCKSKAVHPSYRAGFIDLVFSRFSCIPYRCAVCSWRFYVHRPNSPGRAASHVN